jgi:hypothetical protein
LGGGGGLGAGAGAGAGAGVGAAQAAIKSIIVNINVKHINPLNPEFNFLLYIISSSYRCLVPHFKFNVLPISTTPFHF